MSAGFFLLVGVLLGAPSVDDRPHATALDDCITKGAYREAAAVQKLEPGQSKLLAERIMAGCAALTGPAFDELDAQAEHGDLSPEDRHAIFSAAFEAQARALVEELVRAAGRKPSRG